jgi:hypothetical protein
MQRLHHMPIEGVSVSPKLTRFVAFRTFRQRANNPYSSDCVEGDSVLTKWLSARSAIRESAKTSPKHYENDVFGPRSGAQESAKEFFNTLGNSPKFAMTAF